MAGLVYLSDYLEEDLHNSERDFLYSGKETIVAGPKNPYIIFNENNTKCKSIIFFNTHFEHLVLFENIDLKGGVFFLNCNFKCGLQLQNIKLNASTKNVEGQDIHASLLLFNCSLGSNGISIQNKSEFTGLVQIEGKPENSSIQGLKISNCIFRNSLKIKESFISEKFDISENEITSEFRLEKNNVSCSIRQSENTYGSLLYINNIIEKDVFLKEKGITGSLVFNGGEFFETITIDPIRNITESTRLTLEGAVFHKDFVINYYNRNNPFVHNRGCRKVYIANNVFNSGFFINDHESPFEDGYSEPVFIIIKISNKFEGLLKISNFDLLGLEMSGSNLKGNISFKNLSFDTLRIHDFNNYNNLQFINCRASDKTQKTFLVFRNSFFEKTNFINCDLGGFNKYELSNNNLTQIKSANTKWFGYSSLIFDFEASFDDSSINEQRLLIEAKIAGLKYSNYIKAENISQVRETFRQLKYAMESQGERIEALKFKSSEMKAYHKFLDLSEGNWKDRFILFVGQTNDYGLNWWKPILILVPTIILIFYPLILIAANKQLSFFTFHFDSATFTLKELIMGAKIIPELFNPTHSLDKSFVGEKYEIDLLASTFDFLSRIFLYFFIFQIVNAFRKFGK